MKIDNDKQVVLLNNLTKPSSTNSGKGAGSDGSQTVTDSGRQGRAFRLEGRGGELTAQAAALPDVDEEKVARVKQAIESGTYNASGRMVARAMIKSNLLDETL